VREEQHVAEGIVTDIQVVLNGNLENIDVGVTSVRPTEMPLVWPSESEVAQAIVLDDAHGPQHPMFFWEDHTHENSHPDSRRIRKFRELASAKTVGGTTRHMEGLKRQHYGNVGVYPFILSAGGALGASAKALMDTMTSLSSQQVGDQSASRRRIVGRLAVLLIRAATRLNVASAQSALK
jgi:hypothetical protein